MAFTLYNAPQSTCSQRVRFVLNAKGLPFAEHKLDLLAGDQLKPEYLALNPNGVVPTLDHDGKIVIDSAVIIEYLDEVVPEAAHFTPRDPVKRAAMRSLMRFIDEMPAAAVRVPTYNLAFLPRFAAMSDEEFVAFAEIEAAAQGVPDGDGPHRFPAEGDGHLARAACAAAMSAWTSRSRTAAGRGCSGKDITLADVSVMPALVRMADLGRDGDWADLPRVAKWYELIRAQPAFKPTYYPGSLLTERFPHLRK